MQIHHITNNLMDGPRLVAAVTRIGMLAFLALTAIMWGINGWGKMEVNFAFAFLAFFLAFFVIVSPKATVPWLGVRAVSAETASQINQVLLKILLSVMLTAIFLATWSFKASPWNFWALFTLLLALLTWQLVHKGNAEITKKLQLGYILICIALVLLKTMGVDLQSKLSDKVSGSSQEETEATGGAATSNKGSNCPKSAPCPAYAGYELTLTADKPLTYRLSVVAEKNGLEVKVTDPELRAAVDDSKLFKINQQLGTQVFTITPEPGFAEYVKGGVLHLKMYPLGQGDQVAQDYGVYTPPIDLSAA